MTDPWLEAIVKRLKKGESIYQILGLKEPSRPKLTCSVCGTQFPHPGGPGKPRTLCGNERCVRASRHGKGVRGQRARMVILDEMADE